VIKRNSYILILLGIIGLAGFIFLRPYTDFYAGSPISESRLQVETKLADISQNLGFSLDSLEVYTARKQHGKYYSDLLDTLDQEFTPYELNQRNRHFQSWVSVIGKKGAVSEMIISPGSLFESYGRLKVRFSNSGKVIRMVPSEFSPNPTFLKGNSPIEIAETVIGNILGYDLSMYQFQNEEEDSTSIVLDERPSETPLPNRASVLSSGLEFNWLRKGDDHSVPALLSINLESVIKEYDQDDVFRTEFGYKINSFVAKNEFEPEQLDAASAQNDTAFIIVFFGCLILIVICTFVVGVKNIFKGKVEWRRALFMFASVGLGVYGWQALFSMSSFMPFYGDTIILGAAVNNLIFGLAVGIYMALAYVAWEALARSQKHAQLDVIDALWQRKVFVREAGSGLIHGYALSGIIIGLFSLTIFVLGLYFSQSDSQFGFTEPSNKFQLLTLNMSTWTTTWLVVFVQIGFVYGLIHHWIKNKFLAVIVSIAVSALLVSTLGRLVGTNGAFYEDYLIFLVVSGVTIVGYQKYGILTILTAWWVFATVYMITPYWNSTSIEVAYIAWAQTGIIALPLVYGLIAYRFGMPLSEVGDYIPEYEERITQHLRVEREIEIARESQYKLMPLKPPIADGFDVHGFFLPSFEVGGDYFDYVLSKDEEGNPKALTMVVVDVSGKAMRAAMPAIFTSGLLLARIKEDSPAQILSEVSEPIFSRTDKRTFITCAMARYDLESKMISIANAGHCKPILKRNGKADFIQTQGPRFPLGIKPDVKYQNLEFKLKKGDFFLLYSDGLPEAANEQGEWFGFEEVPALVERIDTENLSANEIAQEIKRTVQKFSNYQLADDTTVICLKV
jgi:serine phosphatase RsbU (regulator of sigma subunit)